MGEYIVSRRYEEYEREIFQQHKEQYPDLIMCWEEGRIIYDADYYGDDYIPAYGTAKQRYIYREDAESMAQKISGRVRRVR